MSKEFRFSVLFPFLAILMIAVYGGGLGTLFIVLDEVIGVEAVGRARSVAGVRGADSRLLAHSQRAGGVVSTPSSDMRPDRCDRSPCSLHRALGFGRALGLTLLIAIALLITLGGCGNRQAEDEFNGTVLKSTEPSPQFNLTNQARPTSYPQEPAGPSRCPHVPVHLLSRCVSHHHDPAEGRPHTVGRGSKQRRVHSHKRRSRARHCGSCARVSQALEACGRVAVLGRQP